MPPVTRKKIQMLIAAAVPKDAAMYMRLKGNKGASGSSGLLVTMAVCAPMNDSSKNKKVPQNSPKITTTRFLAGELTPSTLSGCIGSEAWVFRKNDVFGDMVAQ
jgi:hypothetical protein